MNQPNKTNTMTYRLFAVLSSLFLFSPFAFADISISFGSFDSDELIGDSELRGDNLGSVYYNGAGSYTVFFNAEQAGTVDDYVAIPTGWKGGVARICDVDRQSKTLDSFTITCKDSDGHSADPKNVQFAVFRSDE